MASRLTHKEKGFVKDIEKGETGVRAALNNYNTTDYSTAGAIASENLKKPKILKALGLDDESLEKKHSQLLNQKKLDYFVFKKSFEDEEIIAMVQEDTGIKIINIRETDKGKIAWYSTDDAMAQDKALDKAYKLKGKYAPEKSVNVNIEVEADAVVKKLTEQLNEIHRGTGVTSNGGASSAVGAKAQNKKRDRDTA